MATLCLMPWRITSWSETGFDGKVRPLGCVQEEAVHPVDYPLLGIEWHNRVYCDQALPLGLLSTPEIFTAGG